MKEENLTKCFNEGKVRKMVGCFIDGEPHGKVFEYDVNDNLLYETDYVDGKKSGKQIEYYWDGKKQSETEWVDGKKNGTEVIYREDGKVHKLAYYVDGKKQGKTMSYPFSSNIEHIEIDYEDDKEHGLIVVHYADKAKAPKITYCVEGVEVSAHRYALAVRNGKAPDKTEEVARIIEEFNAGCKKEIEPGGEE